MGKGLSSRVEPSAEVTRIEAPSYLQQLAKDDLSVAEMGKYRILQRVSILQALSKAEVKDAYGEGAVLLMPSKTPVARMNESFLFVPLFFFPEFILWRDRRDNGGAAVIERSLDPTSELARRAADPSRRKEKYEGGPADSPFVRRFVEHLTFAGLIVEKGASGEVDPMTACAVSFSKGEHFNGQNFIGAIMKRKVGPPPAPTAPLYTQVWRLAPGRHKNKVGNEWVGLDYQVDANRPWVTEQEAKEFKALHEQLADEHRKRRLVVDQTGDDVEGDAAADEPLDEKNAKF